MDQELVYVDLNVELRPLRLGFLVNPRNSNDIRKAIEINSFVWGGTFNPIIPVYQRLPKALKTSKGDTGDSVTQGYVDAFDPDYLVTFDGSKLVYDKRFNRTTVYEAEISDQINSKGAPAFGVGLFEILNHILEKELKFVRREPLDIVNAKLSGNYQLFLSSIYGNWAPKVLETYENNYKEKLGARDVEISISNFHEGFGTRHLLRRLSALHGLEVRTTGSPFRQIFVFYLDAANPLDIIDYWNLRATGLSVFPYAKQAKGNADLHEAAIAFISGAYEPSPYNSKIYNTPTILKSRTISDSEFQRFAKGLDEPRTRTSAGEPKMVRQNYYPRMWDNWQVEQRQVSTCSVVSKAESREITCLDERVAFDVLTPDFGMNVGGDVSPRFANVTNLKAFARSKVYAEVIPHGVEGMNEAFNLGSFREIRFSKSGLVMMRAHYEGRRAYLYLPQAEDVFTKWLAQGKWEVNVSDKGRIAKQMLKQLQGKRGINILAKEGIVKLIGALSGDATISQEFLRGELARIGNTPPLYDASVLLEAVTNVNMLRLGIELQCPICLQRSWHSIKDTDYKVQCLKCLDEFDFPSASPRDIKFAYRTFGSFNLPSQAYGTYTVLLALRFFSVLMDASTTPIMSFTAKKGPINIEADLALLYNRFRLGERFDEMFVECKTNNSFLAVDTKRMRLLGEQFPGAVLVFATLKNALSTEEKELIAKLVNWSRKLQAIGKRFNPILILTANELCSTQRPPRCWDGTPIDNRFKTWYSVATDMLHLCDATQQIYLDMAGYKYLPAAA